MFAHLKEQIRFCRTNLEVVLNQIEHAWILLEHKHRLVDDALTQNVRRLCRLEGLAGWLFSRIAP